MASDEQFSLCWNNFHSNMSTGFHGLLSRGDLVDVTLAAEGRLLQAHKLVLSVCSPYFQEMFKMNPTQHPIVFLKDVSYNALRDLLQFMYQGEVNVKQEELASFISTAEQLQVKGLTGNQSDDNSLPASKPKPSSRPGPRSSQQRQSVNKQETDIESKTITPVALKRPNRPSVTPSNPQSSQPAPAKRKCVDPLEAGPSGTNSKDEFVTIPDDEEPSAVAPKMEPEFVNESLWDDDDDGANNDEGNFGEDDSNMEMSGFGDGSVTGDTTIAGATGEGGAVGDAQGQVILRSYTEEKLQEAIMAVRNGMPSKRAAREFGIPRNSICYRLTKNFKANCFRPRTTKTGPNATLSMEEEAKLADWVVECNRGGYMCRKHDVIFAVREFLRVKKRPNLFVDDTPSYKWYLAFLRRNPKLKTEIIRGVASSNMSRETMMQWFVDL